MEIQEEVENKEEPVTQSVTVKEYNELQFEALKQQMFVMNTLIEKVVRLEKAVEHILEK